MNKIEPNKIAIITNLQIACYNTYSKVVSQLQVGISEWEIAERIRAEMRQKDILEYWYDVPIMVLIGSKRFFDMANKNYSIKSPHQDIYLQEGDPIYIDIHPQDTKTKLWGDWNSMMVFHPKKFIDDEQIAFLEEIRTIQREGIKQLQSDMKASDVAFLFLTEFKKRNITLLDVHNNVGHSMHAGSKLPEKRIFLQKGINKILGEGVYTIEPGGYREKKSGKGLVVGRFEESVYIPTKGKAKILGKKDDLPLVINIV